MSEPCRQEKTIGEMTATLLFFQDAERRREKRDERMVAAMETVAAQGETIKSHAETLARHEKGFSAMFDRMRDLELAEEEEEDDPPKALAITILESRLGPFILAAVLLNTITNLLVNYELMSRLILLGKVGG